MDSLAHLHAGVGSTNDSPSEQAMTVRRKEIERLVSEYGAESYAGALPGRQHEAYPALMSAIDALLADLARAEKDTDRLDWLIHTIHRDTMERYLGRPCNTTDDVRPAIDAAIAQETNDASN